MELQRALSDWTWLELTKSPFIDDCVVVGVVEKAGSNPRLHNESRQFHLIRYFQQGRWSNEGHRQKKRD